MEYCPSHNFICSLESLPISPVFDFNGIIFCATHMAILILSKYASYVSCIECSLQSFVVHRHAAAVVSLSGFVEILSTRIQFEVDQYRTLGVIGGFQPLNC